MTSFNCSKDVKPLIKQLEESLSSAKWSDFANPLNKSTEILRAVLRLSAIFPTLETPDDTLHENAKCVFENNIRNVNNILHFCARSLPEEDLCAVRQKLEKFLPELRSVKTDLEILDLKPDNESEGNIGRHLQVITSMMNNFQELLTYFKEAFFVCKHASSSYFCTEEFIKVSSALTEITTMLESKSVSTNAHTGGNRFLMVLFNLLDRPLKIALRALWLLFTFPAIERVKFDVILTLCRSAVRIFVCAVDILTDITRFFLKDFVTVESVKDELLQKFQLVSDYCNQLLELEPSDNSINGELGIKNSTGETSVPKPTVDINGMHCNSAEFSEEMQETSSLQAMIDEMDSLEKSVDISEETEETYVSKATVVMEDMLCKSADNSEGTSALKQTVSVKDTHCCNVNISKKTKGTSVPKLTVLAKDTLCKSIEISGDMQSTSVPKLIILAKNAICKSDEILEETQETFTLKPTCDENDAYCNTVDILKEIQETSLPDPTVIVRDVLHKRTEILEGAQGASELEPSVDMEDTLCDSVDTFKQTQITSLPKLTAILEDTLCESAEISTETKETPAPKVLLKDTLCKAAEISEETREASTFKPTVDFDNTNRDSVFIPEEPSETLLPNLTLTVEDILCESAVILEETRETSMFKSMVVEENAQCNNVNASKQMEVISLPTSIAIMKDTCRKSAEISEKTQETSVLNSSINVKNAHCSSVNILEKTGGTATQKSVNVKNTHCYNINTSKKSPKTSALKPTVNVKDTHSKKVGISKKTKKTSALKSAVKAARITIINDLKETPKASTLKSTINVKNTHCSSVNILKKAQKTTGLKPTKNVKDTYCNGVNVSKKTPRTSVLKSTKIVKDTYCNGVNVSKKTPRVSVLKSSRNVKDTYCNGVNVTKKTRTSAFKTTANVKDTHPKKVGVLKKTPKTPATKSAVKATHCLSIDDLKKIPKSSALKSTVNVNGAHCGGVDKSKKTVKTSGPKLTVTVKDMHFKKVGILKETQKTSAVKSAVNASGDGLKNEQRMSALKPTSVTANDATVPKSSCDLNFNIVDTPKVPKETTVLKARMSLKGFKNTHFDYSQETHKTSLQQRSNVDISTGTYDAKPKAKIKPTHRDTSSPSGPFLDLWDIKFDSLTSEQRKTLEKVISNYKHHANLLAFSVKMCKSEFQVHCKMCGHFFTAEDIEEHLKDQSHLQNIVKKSKDNPEARAAVSINRASSMSHPVTLFLNISDIELNSLVPSQKETLQGLVEKINYHRNCFSFAVKTTESELKVICKICGIASALVNIEEHIKDPKHQWNIFRNCKKCPKTRAAVPEIRAENWKFLKPSPGERYQCSLCAQVIGPSVNSWIQHFSSFCHRMKLKDSKELFNSTRKPVFEKLFGRKMFAVDRRRTASIRARVFPYTKPQINIGPKVNRNRSFVVSVWKKSDSSEQNTASNVSKGIPPNPVQNSSQNLAHTVHNSLQTTVSETSQGFSQNLAHSFLRSASQNPTQNLVQSLLIPEPINLEENSFSQIFYLLSPSNQQIVRNIVAQIKNKINDFSLSIKSGSDELLLACKVCRSQMRPEKVVIHVADPRHLQMVAQSRVDPSAVTVQEPKHFVQQSASQSIAQNLVQSPATALLPEPIKLEHSFNQVFNSLSPNNQQIVRNIFARVKNKISNFGLSTEPGSDELRFTCKICCCLMRPESVEAHVSDPRHVRMVVKQRAQKQ